MFSRNLLSTSGLARNAPSLCRLLFFKSATSAKEILMLERTPKQFDLGKPQRLSRGALRNSPHEAAGEKESTVGDGN